MLGPTETGVIRDQSLQILTEVENQTLFHFKRPSITTCTLPDFQMFHRLCMPFKAMLARTSVNLGTYLLGHAL